jgi:thioredoxin
MRQMHAGLSFEDYDVKTLKIQTIMENIKDYQQYLRGYNYTGVTPVIIDFYATWCGPCQALAPMLKRLANEYDGRIKVLKVDVDKNQALAAAARIQSIPTLFFITKEGDIERVIGGLPSGTCKNGYGNFGINGIPHAYTSANI